MCGHGQLYLDPAKPTFGSVLLFCSVFRVQAGRAGISLRAGAAGM